MVPSARAWMSWSGGKDACAALGLLRRDRTTTVQALLTTLADDPARVAIHEVPATLIRRQAQALGLRLVEGVVPAGSSNEAYEAALSSAVAAARSEGVDTLAYGDLHLEDVRAYRDAAARRLGVRTLYPNWGREPAAFARLIVAMGIRAVVCAVDGAKLPAEFAGRDYDDAFLADLPPSVDPCGENGEFHTFVYDGPGFSAPVPFACGEPRAEGALIVSPLAPPCPQRGG
ncbi:MAG: ATP-binding protein [Caulobacteraceae bacterium]|nr:ATP-binding protein [Caulobacter sp.]